MQLGSAPFHVAGLVALDVRRHDERLLYGAIRGTLHVPVEELPAALTLSPMRWRERFGLPKPSRECPLVVLSRVCARAAWAAQLCVDLGYCR